MLKIRLQRKGKKNQPFFRIIVTEKNNPPRGGRAVEILGFLNPLTKEQEINADRVKYWLSVGAQPSDRVHNLLVQDGIIKGDKKPVHAKAKKKEGEGDAQPKAKPAEKPKEVKEPEAPKEKKKKDVKEEKKEDKPKEDKKPEEKPELKKEEKKEPEAKPEEPKKEEKPVEKKD